MCEMCVLHLIANAFEKILMEVNWETRKWHCVDDNVFAANRDGGVAAEEGDAYF